MPVAELEAKQQQIDTMVMQEALTPFYEDTKYDLEPASIGTLTDFAMLEFEVLESGEIRNKSIGGTSLKKWVRSDLRKSSPFLYVHGEATELSQSGDVWIPNQVTREKLSTDALWALASQEKQS